MRSFPFPRRSATAFRIRDAIAAALRICCTEGASGDILARLAARGATKPVDPVTLLLQVEYEEVGANAWIAPPGRFHDEQGMKRTIFAEEGGMHR